MPIDPILGLKLPVLAEVKGGIDRRGIEAAQAFEVFCKQPSLTSKQLGPGSPKSEQAHAELNASGTPRREASSIASP